MKIQWLLFASLATLPTLAFAQKAKKPVPLVQSTKFHERLRAADIESELRILEGAGRGGPQFESETERAAILTFFEKNLR